MLISELARYAGVSVKTIRHYHSVGLLPEPDRAENGYRRYGSTALVRLRMLRRLRDAGLSIPQVRVVCDSPDPARTVIDILARIEADLMAQRRDVDERIARLGDLRSTGGDAWTALRTGAPGRSLGDDRLERAQEFGRRIIAGLRGFHWSEQELANVERILRELKTPADMIIARIREDPDSLESALVELVTTAGRNRRVDRRLSELVAALALQEQSDIGLSAAESSVLERLIGDHPPG